MSRELRGAHGSPTSLLDPRAPLPPLLLPERPPLSGTPSQLRPLPLFHPRHPVSFSGPSFPPPQPFLVPVPSYLRPPCTPLASELQTAPPTTVLTMVTLNRPPQPQERGDRSRQQQRQPRHPLASFSPQWPLPQTQGPKWGSCPAQGASPKRRSQREPMPPRLSSLCSLFFVHGGPGCDVFAFRLFIGFFFFLLFFFIFWPGIGSDERPPPGLLRQLAAVGSFL